MAESALDELLLRGLTGRTPWKAECDACATTNVTRSGEQTVDGVALVAGDRCLLTAQTADKDNGIFTVSTGSWARAADFGGISTCRIGSTVLVARGTSNSGVYRMTSPTSGDVTPGVTATTWTKIGEFASGGAGSGDIEGVTAGNGLTGGGASGAVTLDVAATDSTITVAADGIKVATDGVTNTELANMAEATIKGRASGAGTGDPTDLSAAQVLTILGIAAADQPVYIRNGTVDLNAAQAWADLGSPIAIDASTTAHFELSMQASWPAWSYGGGEPVAVDDDTVIDLVRFAVTRDGSNVCTIIQKNDVANTTGWYLYGGTSPGDTAPVHVRAIDDGAAGFQLQIRRGTNQANATAVASVECAVRTLTSQAWAGDASITFTGSDGRRLSSATPIVASGAGDSGASIDFSRADHVHPTEGGGTYTAGDGLTLTGSDFDIDLTDTTIFTTAAAASRVPILNGSSLVPCLGATGTTMALASTGGAASLTGSTTAALAASGGACTVTGSTTMTCTASSGAATVTGTTAVLSATGGNARVSASTSISLWTDSGVSIRNTAGDSDNEFSIAVADAGVTCATARQATDTAARYLLMRAAQASSGATGGNSVGGALYLGGGRGETPGTDKGGDVWISAGRHVADNSTASVRISYGDATDDDFENTLIRFYRSTGSTSVVEATAQLQFTSTASSVAFASADLTVLDSTNGTYIECGGAVRIQANGTGLGFFNTTPAAKPTVTGSRGGNAALASLLTAMATLGLITDSSSA